MEETPWGFESPLSQTLRKDPMFQVLVLLLALVSSPLAAESPDSSISSFELREKKYVEEMSFPGEYANLEKIDIDGRRKYRAEFTLPGSYPKLASVNYTASLGKLVAGLKGDFPELTSIEFIGASADMVIDLTGHFAKCCHVQISSQAGDVEILLPKDVGISLETKMGYKGSVVVFESLKKQGRGWLNKSYATDHEEKKFLITARTDSGTLTFKEKN